MEDRRKAHETLNRLQTVTWLENYSQFFGKEGMGLLNFEELGRPGPTTPFNVHNLDYLDSEEAWESHRRLKEALEWLRRRRFMLYSALISPYLADDPDPRTVDRWIKDHKEGGVGSGFMLEFRKKAIDEIVNRVGSHRLVVPMVVGYARGEKEHDRKQQRLDVLYRIFDKIEAGASKREAIVEASAETQVPERTIYHWVKAVME